MAPTIERFLLVNAISIKRNAKCLLTTALRSRCHQYHPFYTSYSYSYSSCYTARASFSTLFRDEEKPSSSASSGTPNSNSNHHYLYKLIYFNVRGAAEPIRYLLALANVPYEDVRYPMKATSQGFGTDSTFQQDKEAGKFARNMNRLPLLQVLQPDDSSSDSTSNSTYKVVGEMGQSHTICRFLAERHQLMGSTLLEKAWIDATYEHVRDIRSRYLSVKLKSGTERTHWMNQQLPRFCRMLEASIPPQQPQQPQPQPHSPCRWLIGGRPTLADISVYAMLGTQNCVLTGSTSTLTFFDGVATDVVQKAYRDCPKLKASGEFIYVLFITCMHAFIYL